MNQRRPQISRAGTRPTAQSPKDIRWFGMAMALAIAVLFMTGHIGSSQVGNGIPATVGTPFFLGGTTGHNDERDVDIYPAVAYDPATQRYLVVWLSARNVSSSNSGFDLYGRFLTRTGQPLGNEFRISDSTTVARSSRPTLTAGRDGFVVIWTNKGSTCQLVSQIVNDNTPQPDRLIDLGASVHHHSPRLLYNPNTRSYVVVYVSGDDYLPPTLFGANTADCGDNPDSTSQIAITEFTLTDGLPSIVQTVPVSQGSGGAFRPTLAYTSLSHQYLVAWEDRRNAGSALYNFAVFARRMAEDLTTSEKDFALFAGGDFVNDDTSATWTPRPALAAANDRYLAVWFQRSASTNEVTWTGQGRLVPTTGDLVSRFPVVQMTFLQPHLGNAPTGFLDAGYDGGAQEFWVGLSSHMETIWGYLSFVRLQPVSSQGQLLQLDGAVQAGVGVGYSVDYVNDDQISLALFVGNSAVDPAGAPLILTVYGRHTPSHPAQDFDVWVAPVSASGGSSVPPTETPSPEPSPSSTPRSRIYLPAVLK